MTHAAFAEFEDLACGWVDADRAPDVGEVSDHRLAVGCPRRLDDAFPDGGMRSPTVLIVVPTAVAATR
jgi:hypothetical protein